MCWLGGRVARGGRGRGKSGWRGGEAGGGIVGVVEEVGGAVAGGGGGVGVRCGGQGVGGAQLPAQMWGGGGAGVEVVLRWVPGGRRRWGVGWGSGGER